VDALENDHWFQNLCPPFSLKGFQESRVIEEGTLLRWDPIGKYYVVVSIDTIKKEVVIYGDAYNNGYLIYWNAEYQWVLQELLPDGSFSIIS
jgi:hypothetical protein